MFVDATFSCVPIPFYQCLIVMVFDQSLRIYIPVAYILMSGKTEECYWQAFNWLTLEVNDCNPFCVGVDYERASFLMVGLHFPETRLIGCLFHFKQAGRKKMVNFGILENQIKFAMRRGVYDLLTVLPKEDLLKGIAFVRTMIADFICAESADGKINGKEEEASHKLWDEFFNVYFTK